MNGWEGHPLIDWHDNGHGAMNRTACWLLSEVGQGNVFTKQQLREAVPGREQVDRRMRELRAYGWRIDENRDDPGLASNELRFASAGLAVWVRGERAEAGVARISDRIRQSVFRRDNHACIRCGIAAGDYFDDRSGVRARLTLAHRYPGKHRRTTSAADFITACQRCNESLRQHTDVYKDEALLWDGIRELPRSQKEAFSSGYEETPAH